MPYKEFVSITFKDLICSWIAWIGWIFLEKQFNIIPASIICLTNRVLAIYSCINNIYYGVEHNFIQLVLHYQEIHSPNNIIYNIMINSMMPTTIYWWNTTQT